MYRFQLSCDFESNHIIASVSFAKWRKFISYCPIPHCIYFMSQFLWWWPQWRLTRFSNEENTIYPIICASGNVPGKMVIQYFVPNWFCVFFFCARECNISAEHTTRTKYESKIGQISFIETVANSHSAGQRRIYTRKHRILPYKNIRSSISATILLIVFRSERKKYRCTLPKAT